MFRRDQERVRAHLGAHFHLWSASQSGLKHLTPETVMPADSGQIWMREHALAPWRGEVLLTDDCNGLWQSKRDSDFVRPLDEVTWQHDGIRYLNPELVLIHKVASGRPKDDKDLTAALPFMDAKQRNLLRDFIARHAPAHPWLDRLER